ncbi:MAG TPA: riboflavin synthase [Candidatus Eremiobacteraceae bacterium]|nr:riboflavin synthase [Candidatus Eremiobacteraceae bacterium]
MFTGLVRARGEVLKNAPNPIGGTRLTIGAAEIGRGAESGASVSVNGVCLTVALIEASAGELTFDVVPETLARTNLGSLVAGDEVNLEPSLRVGDALDGHVVYGHVDGTATILRIDPEGQGLRLWCATPPALDPLICEKGYVALDGISLTVAAVDDGRFAVALIPETLARTTMRLKAPGDALNVEADPFARYVANIVRKGAP